MVKERRWELRSNCMEEGAGIVSNDQQRIRESTRLRAKRQTEEEIEKEWKHDQMAARGGVRVLTNW